MAAREMGIPAVLGTGVGTATIPDGAWVTVDGSAGGGAVRATVTGKQDLVGLVIDPSAVDAEDVEMLQDLVMSAVNDALRTSRELAEQKMGAVTAGLRIPGLG